MFGYLVADVSKMTDEQYERYRACYCGLCRGLKEGHGQLSRLTLNYDMTFLVLMLESLYEPKEREGKGKCLVHPRSDRSWWQSSVTAYAADMNVALAYHKCRDDWTDDANPLALMEAGVLARKYREIEKRYPRQCGCIADAMKELRKAEIAKREDIDENAAIFGRVMGEIFVWQDDRWSETLRKMGMWLGAFIYIMDACVDLDSDVLFSRYNPLRRYYGLRDNEKRFRDILKMILGECLLYFDRLPLVQDIGIMQNILCAGLWMQFDKKYSDKKGPSDVSGSV